MSQKKSARARRALGLAILGFAVGCGGSPGTATDGGVGGGAAGGSGGVEGASGPEAGTSVAPDGGPERDATVDPAAREALRFVAVGYGSRVRASDDGYTWRGDHAVKSPGGDDDTLLRGVTFGDGRFVAVGGSARGLYMSTANGVDWETSSDEGGWLGGVAYGEGRFVAAGGNGRRVYSEDGRAWTQSAIDYHGAFRDVAYGGGVFVAVGDAGRSARSEDGEAWTEAAAGSEGLVGIAYGAGVFVAVGGGAGRRSADGATWTTASLPGYANNILYAEGRFLAIGGSVGYVSEDGASWSRRELSQAVDHAAYAEGVYVGTRWSVEGAVFLRSLDGLEWARVDTGGNIIADLAGAAP
jgi:hypothetical protein